MKDRYVKISCETCKFFERDWRGGGGRCSHIPALTSITDSEIRIDKRTISDPPRQFCNDYVKSGARTLATDSIETLVAIDPLAEQVDDIMRLRGLVPSTRHVLETLDGLGVLKEVICDSKGTFKVQPPIFSNDRLVMFDDLIDNNPGVHLMSFSRDDRPLRILYLFWDVSNTRFSVEKNISHESWLESDERSKAINEMLEIAKTVPGFPG